jgi:4-amino-4-deoxy-L-arabinose transferase-like glycosyltransferase
MAKRRQADGFPPSAALLVGALTLVGALARLWALRSLPIFGDEAIFLRLAELIRQDPAKHLWVSFQVAQAPVHSWLLALALPLSTDPVRAGRLLSVAMGIATIPAIAWAVRRVVLAFAVTDEEAAAAVPAAVLAGGIVTFSPFFVFAARMARVDALFLLEAALATGASVGIASRAREGRPLVASAVGLGLLMGGTMLTRSAVSYPLWLLPLVALFALRSRGGPALEPSFRRLARSLAIAMAVSLTLWAPMLAAPGRLDLATRLFFLAETHPSMGAAERTLLVGRNLAIAFESLWVYLTPPVFLTAIAAIVWLVWSRRLRVLVFFTAWELILLAPTVVFATAYFPRYALPAALPLVAAAVFGLGRLWPVAATPGFPRARTLVGGILAITLLGWSIHDVARGERDAKRWPLLAIDRVQFVSGLSAGFASEAAVRFLEAEARKKKITVLTPEFSGNPSDAVWLLLGRHSGVRLSYAVDALRQPLLTPVPGRIGMYRLGGDVRGTVAPYETPLGAGEPVFAVSTDPLLTRSGWRPARSVLGDQNPSLVEAARFGNPPGPDGRVESAVVVFLVRGTPSGN